MKGIRFTADASDAGATIAAALRRRLADQSWSQVRLLCETGKVFVSGARALDPSARVSLGMDVEVRPDSPRPQSPAEASGLRIVYEDHDLVVIDKPRGIATVPWLERGPGHVEEEWTVRHLVREAWARAGRRGRSGALQIVHRLDRETSGLLVLARTEVAREALKRTFAAHDIERIYVAIAHGVVSAGRIESTLAEDRGDGLRGSVADPQSGKRAVTYVEPIERLPGATLVRCRLETGRTHQIRIHLAESGHPLVGERRYLRDFPGEPIPSERLALHAAVLGLRHPVTGKALRFESPLPPDFTALLARVRRGGGGSVERATRPIHRRRPGTRRSVSMSQCRPLPRC